uniref:Uncharacterized protein n=1 Tax=Meloidogyne hapla TaxID=6305 RepID=A0A1I8BCJ1_MELHA
MEMQIGQIKSDYKKEIEILKKEFEENISDLNSKFSGLLQENNKQNKDEEKINIEKFNDQNKLLIIGQICKKEIEDLKKESQEKIQKEISDINSKFSALLLESNKKNEEENKINNEVIFNL